MKKKSLICLKLFILSILSTAVFLVISDYKVIKNTVKAAPPQCTPFPRIEVKTPVKTIFGGLGTICCDDVADGWKRVGCTTRDDSATNSNWYVQIEAAAGECCERPPSTDLYGDAIPLPTDVSYQVICARVVP